MDLIAVSKTRTTGEIKELYQLGQRDFGENKVQELLKKSEELSELSEIRWHFIGQLQKNKVNQLLKVKRLVAIHSIGSLDLAKLFMKKEPQQVIDLFLQVNTSGEDEKAGFVSEESVLEALNILKDNPHFKLKGLMTIGPIRTDNFEADTKNSFKQLVTLKQKLDKDHDLNLELSMGMSQDYEIAKELGSNYVRIGSKIFGPRS